jgi:hypothetical protein
MGKGGIEGFEAIPVENLCDACNDCHEHTYEAILEDAEPDDLRQLVKVRLRRSVLALNQVSPLRGVLQIPRSPPQHFWMYFMGQTHFFGVIDRKYSFWECRSCAMYAHIKLKKEAIANAS